MRILIVGASQGTGALSVAAALARGHSVTAFARSPQKLATEHPQLVKHAGDFHDRASLSAAVPGHDAVIVTASATSMAAFKQNPHYFSLGTGYLIEAMQAHGVKRLVVLSAWGVGDSRPQAGFFMDKLLIGWLLKLPYEDHERQEKLVMESSLDWVIARPTRLTDGPAKGKYQQRLGSERVPSSISRADVADFLVDSLEGERWLRKSVALGG